MSQDLGYNPQCFFWIAEYTDGSCLCQFDPSDGHEVLFKSVEQSRLKSFGWYPVTQKLAALVKSQVLKVNPFLPSYRILLSPGRTLIAHRQNHVTPNLGKRWTLYVLGYEEIHNDHTVKVTLRIDESGNIEAG